MKLTALQQRRRHKSQLAGVWVEDTLTTMHSLLVQPQSVDAEQGNNPWSSLSNDRNSSPLTATATNNLLGDTGSTIQNDTFSPPGPTSWRDRDMILSPSPPPQLAQPIHSQPLLQEIDMSQPDPRIASLKAIFPDFDDAVMSVNSPFCFCFGFLNA